MFSSCDIFSLHDNNQNLIWFLTILNEIVSIDDADFNNIFVFVSGMHFDQQCSMTFL